MIPKEKRHERKWIGKVKTDQECFKECADSNDYQTMLGVMGVLIQIRGKTRSCACVQWASKKPIEPSTSVKHCLLRIKDTKTGKHITKKRINHENIIGY